MSSGSSFNSLDAGQRQAFVQKLLTEGPNNACVSIRVVEQENLRAEESVEQVTCCFAQFVSSDLTKTNSWIQELPKEVSDFICDTDAQPTVGNLELIDRNGGPANVDLATGVHALYFCASSVPLSLNLLPEDLELPENVALKVVSLDSTENFEHLKNEDKRENLFSVGSEGFNSQAAQQLKLPLVPLLVLVNGGNVVYTGHPKQLDLKEDLKKLATGVTLSVNENCENEWTGLTSEQRKEKFNSSLETVKAAQMILVSQVQKISHMNGSKQTVSRVAAYGAKPETEEADVTSKLSGLNLGTPVQNNVRLLTAEEVKKMSEESKE